MSLYMLKMKLKSMIWSVMIFVTVILHWKQSLCRHNAITVAVVCLVYLSGKYKEVKTEQFCNMYVAKWFISLDLVTWKKLPYICLPVDNKHGLICVMLCVAAAVMNVSALMFLLYFSVLSITTELF